MKEASHCSDEDQLWNRREEEEVEKEERNCNSGIEEEEGEELEGEKEEGEGQGEGEEEEEDEEERLLPEPRKLLKGGNPDRISALPDSILIHILSFLPTKEAIRTGSLSKTWQFLWTHVSTLVFQNQNFVENDIRNSKFVSFVDRTLVLCRSSNIKKFAVSFRYNQCFNSSVDRWILFATQKNVEDLDLHFPFFPSAHYIYELPQNLYRNSSLTRLSLWNCDVVPSGNIRWTSLKGLSIKYEKLSKDVLAKIISGSPVLEFLKLILQFSLSPKHLAINSASLKLLEIKNCLDDMEIIMAPNLQSLHISGTPCRRKMPLINTPSLVNANLHFSWYAWASDVEDDYEQPGNLLRDLLKRLGHVKELKLGTWCIQVLSILKVKGVPSPLSSCQHLTIDANIRKWDIPGIASILQSSTNLETLVINMAFNPGPGFVISKTFRCCYEFDGDNYWNKSFNGLLLHLKTVKIFGFVVGHFGKFILKLVLFLLENARVLERMVVDARRLPYGRLLQNYAEVTEKLLSFPRASPHAVIVFSESDIKKKS